MQIDLHAKVVTRDGEPAGHVEYAVIDPTTDEITEFVVSTGGLLGKDVLVPHGQVEQASSEGDLIRLRLNKQQLERLPAYLSTDYEGPPPGWMPPPTTTFPYAGFLWPAERAADSELPPTVREPWEARRDVLIDKGMPVLDRNNDDVAAVENVAVEPGGTRLQALDVRLGSALRTLFPGGDVINVTVELVESVDPGAVRLRVDKEELQEHHT